MQRVVVVGAGVIGLSAALHLLERFPGQLDLTVMSEKFSPNTTSDKAGMILFPIDFRTEEEKKRSIFDQEQQIQNWTRATFQKYHSIYMSKENAAAEICLEQGYVFLDSAHPDPWYKDEVFGFRHVKLDSLEASLIHFPPNCVDVWSFSTYIVNTTSYLRWLTGKITEMGANFVQRKVSSFDELSSYNIIINCTGLGSCELVGDQLMHPVRGQAMLVKAPWIRQWYIDTRENCFGYVFPRSTDTVLGGTAEAGNWSESPDPKTSAKILENCQKVFPSLCSAEVVGEWAGLRPQRDPVRLESCQGPGGSLLVHCYGHGGQGIVLSWGCALDIGDIVQESLKPPYRANL